jgi:long-subunit acyl-CoA synthetase (AMP-forming)
MSSKFVSQIFVYGDTTRSFVLALVVTNDDFCRMALSSQQSTSSTVETHDDNDSDSNSSSITEGFHPDLLNDGALNRLILADLHLIAKQAGCLLYF